MIKNKGFTLIEMAVVIVIIAAIAGAIVAGRDLIKQSELRGIMAELENNKAAYKLFVQTYGKAPGDFPKGSLYWPSGTQGCTTGTGSCNGNGDGIISYSLTGGPSGVGGVNENIIALRQMKLAGMLDFPSVQISSAVYNGSTSVEKMIPGTNAPQSRRSGAGYFFSGYETDTNTYVLNNCSDTTSPWAGQFVNSVYIGRPDNLATGDTRGGLSYGALSPQEAFFIDEKMDDGKSVSGSFLGRNTGKIRVFLACNTTVTTNCFSGPSYNVTNTTARDAETCLLGYQLDD